MRCAAACNVALVAFVASGCHFFSDVTPCLDGQACPGGTACDAALGICAAPKPPPPPPTACDAAIDVELGVTVGSTVGVDDSLAAASCAVGHEGAAGEAVFHLALDHDAVLRIDLDPNDFGAGGEAGTATFDGEMYVRQDACDDPFAELQCADAVGKGSREEIIQAFTAGDVFIVVDGPKLIDTGAFTITIEEVQPDGVDACDAAADAGAVCALGSRCSAGGTCEPVDGDTCETAKRLVGASGSESEDTSQLLSDVEAAALCVGEFAGFTTPGPDIFYVVTVPAGALFHAELTTLPTLDMGIYLQTTCPPPLDGSCLNFGDAGGPNFVEHIDFTNDGAADVELSVIVDSFLTSQNGPFTLDWTLTPP